MTSHGCHGRSVQQTRTQRRTWFGRGVRAALAGLAILQAAPADAQADGSVGLDKTTDLISKATDKEYGFRFGSVIVAPIPFRNPSLETGLALGGAHMFKLDEQSDTSTVGIGGFRTTNGSEGIGLGGTVNFDEGKWTIKAGAVASDLNYTLYVAGLPLPIRQSLRGVKLEVDRKVAKAVTIGLSLDYGETTLEDSTGGSLVGGFLANRPFDVYRLGLVAEFDQRDNTTYPTRGVVVKGTLTNGLVDVSDGIDYQKLVVSASGYWPVSKQGVFAATATVCGASSSAPFFDSCALGAVDNFRGFSSAEFIDDTLFSTQVEFRGRMTKRLGYVMFAGAAVTGDDLSAAADSPVRSAVGAGLRIRLSKVFPVDYALDVSRNNRGENLLYVTVGQRF